MAQLGARLNGIQKAGGSSPPVSTILRKTKTTKRKPLKSAVFFGYKTKKWIYNMDMTIELLKILYEKDAVFFTQHVIERCKQRNIHPGQIRTAILNGEIIKDYPDDTPYPS